MEEDRQIKCVTCSAKVDLVNEEYYEYLGKTICIICFESLTGGNNMKKPLIDAPQDCQIPKNPDLQDNVKEVCNGHQKAYKFYCDHCQVSLCIFCIPNHSLHGFSELETKAKSLLSDLHTLEHLTRYTLSLFDNNQPSLDLLLDSILNTFNKVNSRSASSIINFLSIRVKDLFLELQNHNSDLVGLSLAECQKLIKEGRDMMKEPKAFNWVHWCEWNDQSLHLLNLNTMKKTCVLLGQKFHFYCKSASLPYNQVFVCGGRVQSSSPSLKSAFIVYLNEEFRIEKLPDMGVGRSNHCVIYFKGYVYVLAGCNELNQYTNKCERLKIPELKWETITSCPECVDTGSVAGIEDSNFLYLTGGRVNSQALTLDIQKYNVLENFWTCTGLKLPFETSVHGSIFLNNKEILIFAGQNKDSEMVSKSCIINIETGKSETLDNLAKGGCVVNECLKFREKIYFFVFQGFCSRYLQSFDLKTKQWKLEDLN